MSYVFEKYINEKFDDSGVLSEISFNIPSDFNFGFDVVDDIASRCPEKRAMLWCDEEGNERTFTFGDISRLSNKAANVFKNAGIKKGDMVMLVLKRHYQFWYAIMGLCKIGAVAIPGTNMLTTKDLVYRFDAAGVKAIVCTIPDPASDYAAEAAAVCPSMQIMFGVNGKKEGFLDFDSLIEEASDVFTRPEGEDAIKVEDMMLLYFTSGTTGYPKMVWHDFSYPLAHIITARHWHSVVPEGLHLTVAETGWGKAVWGKLYGQWFCEAGIFVYDFGRFVAKNLLSMLEKYRITTFCAPPTIYRFFLAEDLSQYDLSSIREATIAGEALNPEVYKDFYKHTGLKLREGFGQTETTLTVCTLSGMEPKPGSMGKPSPAYKADIILNGESAKPGVTGEIVLKLGEEKQCGLFGGYYRDEERYATVCKDGYYHTGDMAWRDEDNYFWYVGRTDDLIKSSGYRIGPFEVESVLMEHPAVLECGVTGVPDPVRGQVVKATIVLNSGYTPSDELKKDIQNYVKSHTAPFKYPRIVEFVDELPKTISGKIRRVELRK
ncbi:MAG: AMP-binding protein [Clostridiales bacterium]|nr:AMP-binding protein [Clostridiales bacterium]